MLLDLQQDCTLICCVVITEVVEKAKEGYESNVSDLEEDDSVIYHTLGGESTSTGSVSENSGER